MNPFRSQRLVYRAYDSPKDDDFFYSMHSDPNVFLNGWKGLPQPVSRQSLEILRKTALLCRDLQDSGPVQSSTG
jgi:hypothetical protein